MATFSEVLDIVSDVTKYLDTTVEKASLNLATILVKVDDRVTARQDMVDALLGAGLTQGPNDDKNPPSFAGKDFVIGAVPGSGFAGIKIKEGAGSIIRFKFKGKRGGGSGAGAAETKKTESGQAVYAAVAFHLGRKITSADITQQNVNAASSMWDVDETIENIFKMDDAWVKSSILGANELWEKFKKLKNKGIVFHRGSSEVQYIENAFKRVRKSEGARIDINKWSPADIYITTKNYRAACLDEEMTLKGLNQCMNERLINDIMFGVSLKKISSGATLSKLNVDPKQSNEHVFERFYRKGTNAADMYMKFNGGTEIQFRSFDGPKATTGWQGEVKGAKANQGKVGQGSVNLILKLHGLPQIPDVRRMVQTKTGQYGTMVDGIQSLIAETSPGYTEKKYAELIAKKAEDKELDGFEYSMGCSYYLYQIINSIGSKKQKDQVCEDIILYASSRSVISAPYYKLQ
tara:strand:+ start:162 stop:1547 length:1386 start_codon:yes stop_codon:yes gene_type:complete